MDSTAIDSPPLGEASKRLAGRLLTSGGNRIELLMVEVQEEREHLVHILFLGIGAAVLGLLACLALSTAIIILLWALGPVLVLLAMTLIYGGAAALLCRKLLSNQRNWKCFPDTLDQLRKDRIWLERSLS
jgi:uncharacterized membrane protein YqjE